MCRCTIDNYLRGSLFFTVTPVLIILHHLTRRTSQGLDLLAAENFADSRMAVLFLDGRHSYNYVLPETEAYNPSGVTQTANLRTARVETFLAPEAT